MANPAPGFKTHPNHSVVLSKAEYGLEVSLGNVTIAQTRRAIRLEEDRYPARYYVPAEDVQMKYLSPIDASTHCPFKGDARYWNVEAGSKSVENGAWAYDAPYDECAQLRGTIAFYGDQFELEFSEEAGET